MRFRSAAIAASPGCMHCVWKFEKPLRAKTGFAELVTKWPVVLFRRNAESLCILLFRVFFY